MQGLTKVRRQVWRACSRRTRCIAANAIVVIICIVVLAVVGCATACTCCAGPPTITTTALSLCAQLPCKQHGQAHHEQKKRRNNVERFAVRIEQHSIGQKKRNRNVGRQKQQNDGRIQKQKVRFLMMSSTIADAGKENENTRNASRRLAGVAACVVPDRAISCVRVGVFSVCVHTWTAERQRWKEK